MKACLGILHGEPVILELHDGIVSIDGSAEPIKGLTDADLIAFNDEIEAIPKNDDPGSEALVNSVRAAFLAKLLGMAVGDECIDKLSHILDHVHYEVLKYLGEAGE